MKKIDLKIVLSFSVLMEQIEIPVFLIKYLYIYSTPTITPNPMTHKIYIHRTFTNTYIHTSTPKNTLLSNGN